MSSIDKDVISEARKYNSRVRVSNENGYITGTIDGTVVFRIADRYGYINDSERAKIQTAMQEYERLERQRREQEERHRILMEQQRKQEIDSIKASIDRKLKKLEGAMNQARINSEAPQITYNKQLLNGFNVSKLEARIAEARQAYKDSYKMIEDNYNSAKASLEKIKNTISNSTLEVARSKGTEIARIQCNFSVGAEAISNITKLKNEIAIIESSARTINAMLAKLKNVQHSNETEFKIQRILNSVQRYDITSTEDIKELLSKIEEALNDVKIAEACKVSQEIENSLNAINEVILKSRELKIQVQEATYEIRSFESEIQKECEEIKNSIEELMSAEYTTCKEEVFARLEDFLERANGASDDQTLREAQEYRELCTRILTEDETYHLAYEIYKNAIERLSLIPECDLLDEQEFDVKNGKTGVLNQLQRLFEKELQVELANSKAVANLHLSMSNDIMEEMGYSLVTCDTSNELVKVAYYTKKGWDGVVMQIIATESGVKRKLIGVSRNGQRTDPQQILKIAQENENECEPVKFLQMFNQNSITECSIREEGDISSFTDNVVDFIENDSVLDLSEDKIVNVDGKNMTEWEKFNNITQTGSAKNQSIYIKADDDYKRANGAIAQFNDNIKKITTSKTRKRYQNN